jgi:hypothetical protein
MAKCHKKYLDAAKFGMRREDDIGMAMQLHLKRLKKLVARSRPKNIRLKMRVYWPDGSYRESDSKDISEYVLQEVLAGKDGDVFRKCGLCAAAAAREAESVPVGVTISTETMLADEITPSGTGVKVRGLPVLLIAGRSAHGKSNIVTMPLALDNDKIRYIPTDDMAPPPKIVEKLAALRATATDFLSPFFDGLKSLKT